jgi:hypothetical protein
MVVLRGDLHNAPSDLPPCGAAGLLGGEGLLSRRTLDHDINSRSVMRRSIRSSIARARTTCSHAISRAAASARQAAMNAAVDAGDDVTSDA